MIGSLKASDPRRILLVRLRQIGDVVFTTPALRALRTRFPDAHITYIVEPIAAPVVEKNPHLDHVIVAPRRHLPADLALGRQLRHARYDLAIDFHGGPRASLLTWLSRAPVRVGYEIPFRGWMYTTRVARPRELRPRHGVRNQWDLLEPLGVEPPDPDTFPVEMITEPTAAAAVDQRLASLGVDPTDCIVLVHVSAGNRFRRWPLESFAALIAGLAMRASDRRVMVTSGPSDRAAATRVIADAKSRMPPSARDRLLDVAELTLAELRALLDRAGLFIGGDSGPLHIASTSRVPIVGLYGPTLPVRSAPWRDRSLVTESVEIGGLECRPCDQRVCAPGDFRCLTHIGPDEVIAAAERALARAKMYKLQVLR